MGRVAFLFLGETLLIPHLYPIVEALARQGAEPAIDCWLATSTHEELIAGWLARAGLAGRVRLRRVPGFRVTAGSSARPPLPPKIPTLIRLAPHLLAARVVVCAEQTSLWLPRVAPFLGWRFVKAAHGAGSMMARSDPRRRAAYRLLVPAPGEKRRLVALGIAAERIEVVGYVKSGFRAPARSTPLFAEPRPVVVYAPHWQRHRSSWWRWGREIAALLAAQSRFNVILAPHQRLLETAPEARRVLAAFAALDHVHVDLDSFATVDGSYLQAADIYLGDTSSQVVEFIARPRPCVFLNPAAAAWRGDPDYGFWECGEVVDDLGAVSGALDRAATEHARYEATQRAFVAEMLGDASPAAALRAAAAVRGCL